MNDDAILEFKGPYFWLSNFNMSAFVWLGLRWPSGEHAFQAMKSQSLEVWKEVIALETPSQAKNYGRHVIRLRSDWEAVKLSTMKQVQLAKYYRSGLRQKLLDTGNRHLSEGNWHGDDYWGFCFRTKQGQNHLGKILMEVRNELRLRP